MDQFNQVNKLFQRDLYLKDKNSKQKSGTIFRIIKVILSLWLIVLVSSWWFQYFSQNDSREIKQQLSANAGIQAASIKNTSQPKVTDAPPKNKTDKINILALGKPGPSYPGGDLTDTIILAHINPQEEEIVLISLPRDLLVTYGDIGTRSVKINQLYSLGGITALKQKIIEITGLPIDYYVSINLEALGEIIHLIDGLNIFIPQDINDPYFPGPNYSYQPFNIKKGWRYLDEKTTIKYIRTRYTSPNGDFDRMARQQQTLRAVKQKVLSLNPLWSLPTYLKIFQSMQKHIQTDLSLTKIRSLWKITQEIKIDKIFSLTIDKEKTNLLVSGQIMFGEQKASVVWPKAGQKNYSEIKKFIGKTITVK